MKIYEKIKRCEVLSVNYDGWFIRSPSKSAPFYYNLIGLVTSAGNVNLIQTYALNDAFDTIGIVPFFII